jgi:hypothetical protein
VGARPAQGARAAAQSSSMPFSLEDGGTPRPSISELLFSIAYGISFVQIRLSKGVIAKFFFRNGLRSVFRSLGVEKATLAAVAFFNPLYSV